MENNKNSHSTHREIELLDTLRNMGGAARTANLAAVMRVSEETVRRTVKALTKSKHVKRVHGGAYLAEADPSDTVFSRLEMNQEEKLLIGKAVARAILNHSIVFLDVGSTNIFVAECLKNHSGLTIVTNALHVAQQLAGNNGNRVFFCGGEIREVEFGTFGSDTINFVKKFGIDIAVLTADGIDSVNGFLLAGSEEAELANVVTQRARQVIVAADNSKFGKLAPFVACDPNDVDLLVTNDTPPAPYIENLTQWAIDLRIAKD